MSRLRAAWISLAIAFGLHVADEATHDFLRFYNPNANLIRESLGIPFPPVFSYSEWLGGLVGAFILSILLTPLLDPRRGWTLIAARIWAVIHIINGILHLVTSLSIGRMMPGVLTAPLLLLVAPWLLVETLRARRNRMTIALAMFVIGLQAVSPRELPAQQPVLPYAPVGLFIGSIEEGARIFTPTRLLPFGHPEAGTHQFPTVLQLHGPEFSLLVWLGEQAGYRLWPTLERYPREPARDWPYAGFRQPPDSMALKKARMVRRPRADAPLPGLRAVVFDGVSPIAFIVDTRGLSLAERKMSRATSMGLDLSRADFLAAMQRAARGLKPLELSVVLFSR
jgi:hypothetical protein